MLLTSLLVVVLVLCRKLLKELLQTEEKYIGDLDLCIRVRLGKVIRTDKIPAHMLSFILSCPHHCSRAVVLAKWQQ